MTRFNRSVRNHALFIALLAFVSGVLAPYESLLIVFGIFCGVSGAFILWVLQFDEFGFQKSVELPEEDTVPRDHDREFGDFLMPYFAGFGGVFVTLFPFGFGRMVVAAVWG